MSESLQSSEVEPRAHWLADLDPQRLHTWMLRAFARQQHDLLRTFTPSSESRGPVYEAREAFIDWCAAGVELFLRDGDGLPSRRVIDDTAHRVMIVVVLRRHRSITAAAQALETSRRALRDTMKRLGIYQRWQEWQGEGSTESSRSSGKKSPMSEDID